MTEPRNSQPNLNQSLIALLSLLVVFGGLALLAWVIFQGFLTLSAKIAGANFTTIATLITALISVFGALCVAFISYRATLKSKQEEKNKEIEQELRKQKAPIYENFSELLFRVIKVAKTEEQMSEGEMLEFVIKFNQKLLVWGGDNVIKAWAKFRTISDTDNKYEVLFAVEDILFEIRSDMGHSNKNLKRGELLSVFINDIGHILKEIDIDENTNQLK